MYKRMFSKTNSLGLLPVSDLAGVTCIEILSDSRQRSSVCCYLLIRIKEISEFTKVVEFTKGI